MTATATPPVIGMAAPPALVRVRTSSGQDMHVQSRDEAKFYSGQQQKYLAEHKFTAITDLLDLDRLLFFELLNHRATVQLSSGRNALGHTLTLSEEADCRRAIKEAAPQISSLKNDLGMTKSQRDKEQYESVGSYLVQLRARAAEFGVHRQNQVTKALALINELYSLVGAYDRSDESERQKLGLESADDILEWIRTVMRPEFDAIDQHFRQNQQRTWIREL